MKRLIAKIVYFTLLTAIYLWGAILVGAFLYIFCKECYQVGLKVVLAAVASIIVGIIAMVGLISLLLWSSENRK